MQRKMDRLEELLGIFERKLEPHLEAFEKACEIIGKEAENLIDKNYSVMGLLVSAMIDDKITQDMFSIPFEYMSEGQDNVTLRMGLDYNRFNEYLNSQSESRQDLVGYYDGYLNTYLGTNINRLPNSIEYNDGVEMGKKIGRYSQFWLFANIDEVEGKINPEKYLKKVGNIVKKIFPE